MSSSPPGVSRSSDGNYNSGELALCRHTNFSRGWISSRWCRADWRRGREAPSKLQPEWKLPRRDRQIGSQAGVISPPGPRSLYHQLLPPEAPKEENMCNSSAYSPLPCPQVNKKKVMSMAISRRTVGCRLHLPNWEAKYGGRTPLSGSLNKRPFWIFM